MLVLKRKEGEWVDVIHQSGDVLRIRIYGIKGRQPGRANLAFDDPEHHFEIQRPERYATKPESMADADVDTEPNAAA